MNGADSFAAGADRYFAAYWRGLLPLRTAEALSECVNARLVPAEAHENAWGRYADGSRAALATLLNVPASTLAFTGSASQGVAMVLSARQWRASDTILMLENEYHPYLHFAEQLAGRYGCHVRLARNYDELLEQTAPPVRMVIVSHVCWCTGEARDIRPLTRRAADAGAEVLVDVVHSLGVLPLDLQSWGAEFIVGNSRKWALGLEGLGYLQIRADVVSDLTPELETTLRASRSERHRRDRQNPPASHAYKLEIGGRNKLAHIAFRTSLELLLEVGIEQIADHVTSLSLTAVESLRELRFQVLTGSDPKKASGIVSIGLGTADDATRTRQVLAERGFEVAAVENRLIIASHVFNHEQSLHTLIEHLDHTAKR